MQALAMAFVIIAVKNKGLTMTIRTDRILPQDLNAEAAVLSAMMVDKTCVPYAIEVLRTELFYRNSHKLIFSAMVDMFNNNIEIDIITLIDKLKQSKNKKTHKSYLEMVGGEAFINDLSDVALSGANIKHHSSVVMEKAMLRKNIMIANNMLEMSYRADRPAKEIIQEAETSIFEANRTVRKSYTHISEVLINAENSINEAATNKKNVTGVPSGFVDLDRMIGGFRPGQLIIIAARAAMGKAQPLYSKLITPEGTINMGDATIGSQIIGADGNAYDITGVFPQGEKELWRVTFDDGTYVDCCSEHLWTVQNRADRKAGYGKWAKYKERTITTEDLSKQVYVNNGKRKNFTIPFSLPVQHTKKFLSIHPYLLGLMLGDCYLGYDKITFSNTENDLVKKFKSHLEPGEELVNQKIGEWRLNGSYNIKAKLSHLGLLGKRSGDKFIPKNYLYSNIEDRLSILRGLIDTDGHVVGHKRKGNFIEYSTVSPALKNDIIELVQSLGGRASCISRISKYKKNGKYKITGINYRIYITMPENMCPVSSKKHLAKYTSKKRFHKRFIISVKNLERKVPMQCIMVNSPDHLYLTDNYTPTHNTSLALNFADNAVSMYGKNAFMVNLEMENEECAMRILSARSGVTMDNMIRGYGMDENKIFRISQVSENLSKKGLILDDTPGLTYTEIRARAKRLDSELRSSSPDDHGLDMLLIDYIQLMKTAAKTGTRSEYIGDITRNLKIIAKELGIPLVALSQVNRGVESRDDKRPRLADLKESGSLEEDADVVMFVYRDEVYNQVDKDGNPIDNKGDAELIIAKNRHGSIGTVHLRFEKEFTRFKDKAGWD